MPLSDIAVINISVEKAKATRAGFGLPIIFSPECPGGFTERVRFYSDITGVAVDFATTTATYKQALAIFSQDPRPPTIAVGRLALKPTQRWIAIPVVVDSTKYEIVVDGQTVSFTSGVGTTATLIINGLKAAIDALALTLTTSNQGPNTSLRILANAAAAFHSVKVSDSTLLALAQDHADPGLATDLAAIALEDSSWYAMLFGYNSKACVEALSTYAEANGKLLIAQTQDSDVVNLSNANDTGGAQTIAGELKAAAKARTALIYSQGTDDFADAAWAGAVLPDDPGSETWAFKTLAGVPVSKLTVTQHTNAIAKYANTYEVYAGINVTGVGSSSGGSGKVSANEYIDVIRFRDWLSANMAADIVDAVSSGKKLPFTDAGISVIEGVVRARLRAGVDAGGLASDPAPKVTVPKAKDVSSADKAARKLTGVKFDAVLAGAIQVTSVTGTISV